MRYLNILLVLLLPILMSAQVADPGKNGPDKSRSEVAKFDFQHEEGHIVLKPKTQVAVADFFPAFAKTLRTDAHSSWIAGTVTGGASPQALSHHRFQQHFDDIPLLGATIVLHAKQGLVSFATGKSYPRQALETSPRISENEAIRKAITAFTAWSARQQAHPLENDFTGRPLRVELVSDVRSTIDETRLVYLDRQYPSYTGSLLLAYEIEVGPGAARRAVYIDALSGKLITSIPLVAHATVPGTVETGYYGTQNVMVEENGTNGYRLVDSTRGVVVLNDQGREITNTTVDFPLRSGNKGGMANDVFYGSSRFYDLLKDKFSWLGVDGEGEFFVSSVSDGDRDLVNAFWNGSRATFGGGSCHYDPLTTLDVVGHEFAHGITQRTSDLVYSGQSGALNEGMSDIYGKALELYEQPDQFNWVLGNRFADSEYARPFRSMEDPNLYNKPKVVGGAFWNDGAGVHTNSGPLGHWFYLLIEGGSGMNDLGTAFDVQPVGLDIAFDVAFQLNRDYLTESSGYQDAFTNCMLLVESAYGINSDTYESFTEAWKAIGLPASGTTEPPSGVDLAVFSFNSSDPRYCHPTDSVELIVVLSNRGDDVLAGTSYTLTATIDNETSVVTRTFEEDFLRGELDFLNVLFPINLVPGEYLATVTVDIDNDIDLDNNSGSQTAYYLQAPHVIEIDGIILEDLDCFDDEREIVVNLLNRGCETYSGPVVIDIFDADSTILKTINTGNRILTPGEGGQMFVTLVIDYDELEGAVGLRFDVPNDPIPEDNIVSAQLGRPRVLTNTGFVQFSDSDAERFVSLDDSRGHMGIVTERNQDWLGTTGYFTNPFRLACLETETNLDVAFDLSITEMCVDFEAEPTPKLSFDLLQFYGDGDPDFPGLADFSRGMSVSTPTLTSSMPVFLDSRPDGISSNVEVELPANHRGLVRFTMYNASGSPTNWQNSDPLFETYDYTFINNIRLAGVSNVRELTVEYSIQPNPARDYFTIQTSSEEALQVEVFNSIGQLMTEQTLNTQSTFATQAWPDGIYLIQLSDEKGARKTERLVVAR